MNEPYIPIMLNPDESPYPRDIITRYGKNKISAYKKHIFEQTQKMAYRMWEEAGCPEGKSEYFWEEAEKKLLELINIGLRFESLTEGIWRKNEQ